MVGVQHGLADDFNVGPNKNEEKRENERVRESSPLMAEFSASCLSQRPPAHRQPAETLREESLPEKKKYNFTPHILSLSLKTLHFSQIHQSINQSSTLSGW